MYIGMNESRWYPDLLFILFDAWSLHLGLARCYVAMNEQTIIYFKFTLFICFLFFFFCFFLINYLITFI